MLHRSLFVAGMTVGVMAPLVWAAYVSRPAPQTARAPAATLAKATPETNQPAPTRTKDVTASIPPAPVATRAAPKIARGHPKPARVARRHRVRERTRPAVVNRYNGAHIIVVCAALTANEQLRAGCP